jgi:hypothetical protein
VEGPSSLEFETGPGPRVILELPAMEIEKAQEIARALTPVAEVVVDFSYFAGGYCPN